MATLYISRERDPQSEENGVAVGAFDFEIGNFLRI